MHRDHPRSRRRARAIAISDSANRAAALRMGLMVLAGLAALAEAALLAERLWAAHA